MTPDIVAGLSLGEYSALVAAGALSFEEASRFGSQAGWIYGNSCACWKREDGSSHEHRSCLIEEICQKASVKGVVTPANYNTPSQIVIGGEVEAVDYAVELLQEAGAKRLNST